MIRRSPAEVYLKYLLVHPKKHTNEEVIQICRFAQVDYLGNWYLDRLRSLLDPPRPFFPNDPRHRASRTWLLTNGLSFIFNPDEYGRKAFDILKRPRVKEFVESSLISHAPVLAIADAVTRHHNFVCTPKTVERFRGFFWDIENLDSTELRALLMMRNDWMADHPDFKDQAGAMKKAYWNDPRRSAANLPFSPISALLSQVRMGTMPANLDIAKIMDQTRGVALLRLFEAIAADGPNDSKKALDLSIVLEKITNTMKEVAQPQEEMQKELAAITMRTDDKPTPTVHQLSAGGGSFTTDNGPKQEDTNGLPTPDYDDGGDEADPG